MSPSRDHGMAETIHLGEIAIAVTRKKIKHVHMSVYPPAGRVTLVAPAGTPESAGTAAYGPDGGFLGLVAVGANGEIRVERLFVSGGAGPAGPATST